MCRLEGTTGVGITTAGENKHFATPREYFRFHKVNKQSIVRRDKSAGLNPEAVHPIGPPSLNHLEGIATGRGAKNLVVVVSK